MADASRHASFSNLPPPPAPGDWREAFAALPQDAPDGSRWPALAQAVAARNAARARRRRIGLALAAGLCALALLPFALRRPADLPATGTPPRTATATTPADAHVADATPAATPPASANAPAAAEVAADTEATADLAAADTSPDRAAAPRVRAAPRTPPRGRALAVRDTMSEQRRAATAAAATTATATDAAPARATGDDDASLDTLYAASAQLEALLALARDPRVDSGPAAALAGGYDAEIATVDAQLAQPDLSLDAQRRLWRTRVELLQQATGLESQLRVLAASGRQLDGALVRVD